MRLDVYLVSNNYFPSRERAKFAINSGSVLVNNKVEQKPALEISETDIVTIQSVALKYVSKGGLKLEKAINDFSLNFKGKTVLDIGASTGGFTDCALQHGAKFCFCVDVGTNQLDEKLKNNKQILSIENLHIKDLTIGHLKNKKADFTVIDVSFISLTHIFQYLYEFLNENGKIIALIKPQFEAGKTNLNKSGIVKEPKVHKKIIENIIISAKQHNLFPENLSYSPIYEKNKNIEYLALFSSQNTNAKVDISNIIAKAFEYQKKL